MQLLSLSCVICISGEARRYTHTHTHRQGGERGKRRQIGGEKGMTGGVKKKKKWCRGRGGGSRVRGLGWAGLGCSGVRWGELRSVWRCEVWTGRSGDDTAVGGGVGGGFKKRETGRREAALLTARPPLHLQHHLPACNLATPIPPPPPHLTVSCHPTHTHTHAEGLPQRQTAVMADNVCNYQAGQPRAALMEIPAPPHPGGPLVPPHSP